MLAKLIDGTLVLLPASYEVEREQREDFTVYPDDFADWPEEDKEAFPREYRTFSAMVWISGYDMLTEEEHLADGWKPVVETPMPEREGYYYIDKFEEADDAILQDWKEYEIPPAPPDPYAFIQALMEGYLEEDEPHD